MNGSLAMRGFKKPRDIASFEDAIEKSRTEAGLINIGTLRSKIRMVDGGMCVRDNDSVDLTLLLVAIGTLCALCPIERRGAQTRLDQLKNRPGFSYKQLLDRMEWLRRESTHLARVAPHSVDREKLQAVSDWAEQHINEADRQVMRVA